ncbi:MAG: nucleoside recognition protein [candidate division Zixibacteria bacterium]|nr:nucleoside recognition protein [candidate division Zixibacteria bacterium]
MAREIAGGLWGLGLKVFIIVMPLITFLEWAKSQTWFTRAIDGAMPLFRPIGFRPQSLFPLLTGVLFGISYGAGVLIPQARSGDLDARQVFLIGAFLSVCHAIIEDTLLFVSLGASGTVLLGTRIVVAMVVVGALARLPWPRPALAHDPQP